MQPFLNAGKWWASFLMLLGRLELFTVLILFTPFFGKKLIAVFIFPTTFRKSRILFLLDFSWIV